MQNVIDFILSNLIIIFVVIAYVLSRIKLKPNPNQTNKPSTPNSSGPERPFPDRTNMPDSRPFPDRTHMPERRPFPDRPQGDRPFPERVQGASPDAERDTRSHLERVQSLLNEHEELQSSSPAEQESAEKVSKTRPYDRPYQKPYRLQSEGRTADGLARRAVEGMMWSQIYGPPRSRTPFQYRKYKRQ